MNEARTHTEVRLQKDTDAYALCLWVPLEVFGPWRWDAVVCLLILQLMALPA